MSYQMFDVLEDWLFDDLFNVERYLGRLQSGKGVQIAVHVKGRDVLERIFSYDEITIGRAHPTVDVDLDLTPFDDEKTVSRKAIVIRREGEEYYIIRTGEVSVLLRNEFANDVFLEKDKPYKLSKTSDNFVVIWGKQKIGLKIRIKL
ncbi:FHA domain-containing protein [Fervidobacterium thailandense]|uniref:FHA domain-containing protein n=1 Tax=Fervidobacterium thailandense TaxID=1008305 RepID=A0A1E3G3L8_9BACT|nr:FHA domain-containing protein [Fervidobacterium thailandense]ODN30772.1 hypothetical protein A4H02_04395 [Fervidobacterium thailandense]